MVPEARNKDPLGLLQLHGDDAAGEQSAGISRIGSLAKSVLEPGWVHNRRHTRHLPLARKACSPTQESLKP